jgi:nitrite reductase/ring-hydroxylating ferredoxin subunit
MTDTSPASAAQDPNARRSFLAAFTAAVCGGILAIFPFAAGWSVFAHPLGRRGKGEEDGGEGTPSSAPFVRICPLDAVPADGIPRQFPVVTDVVDAWSRTPGQRIGSVYLARTDEGGTPTVSCFTTTCPHLGCAVDWHAGPGQFECPCHESAFAKDGKKLFGPSLRGLDPLDVKLVAENGRTDVLVAFERFRTGVAERIPVG